MNFFKKISLIFAGILISLVILEIFLQLSGLALTTIKKCQNKNLNDPNVITILCLGESTTDGQWPPILQKILDDRAKHKNFKVIDEGHIGTNSSVIASKIKDYLTKYNPDAVVTMIGINDFGLNYKKSKSKTLNLFNLLKSHIKTKFFFDYSNTALKLIEHETSELINNKQFLAAEKKYLDLWILSKKSSVLIYSKLLELYFDRQLYDKFESVFTDNNVANINSNCLTTIFYYLSEVKKYSKEQLHTYVRENQNKIFYNNNLELLLQKYELQDLIETIKQNNVKADDTLVKVQINIEPVKILSLIENYKDILNEIHTYNSKIKIMPMQYPNLPVKSLKKQLKNYKYYNELIFLSNEKNFDEALKKHKTEDIFIDLFGDINSFGHCTEFGNTLIAQNVAETILKLYDKQ